jgi:hypothetical protein
LLPVKTHKRLTMPDKPRWLDRLPQAIAFLEASPLPWVDRATVEGLLGVRRRRAQQILAPLASQRNGHTGIVERDALVHHLRRIAAGETALYEHNRRRRLWDQVERERRRWTETPPVFVEPPPEVLRSVYRDDFEGLPSGVDLSPGRITITFDHSDQALEKLLALAMAIGRNRPAFDERVGEPPQPAIAKKQLHT